MIAPDSWLKVYDTHMVSVCICPYVYVGLYMYVVDV